MSQEKLQTMVMQKFWGLIQVYYGIVQVVNVNYLYMVRNVCTYVQSIFFATR